MATLIHPTAIVPATVELGDGCEIGPYAVLAERVRLGAGTRVHAHAIIEGHTRLGANCEIFPFACIGGKSQDLKYRGGVSHVDIGDGTTLREYVTVHAATAEGGATVIGRNCHILAYSHIAHDCVLGDGVIMSNANQIAGHVVIGDDVVFGGLAGVHQFVRIGCLAMVSATAKVVQDVLPYCLVDGAPAAPVTVNRIGMQRHGLSESAISAVTAAFKIIFRSNLTADAAAAELESRFPDSAEVGNMLRFLRTSERGIARPRSTGA